MQPLSEARRRALTIAISTLVLTTVVSGCGLFANRQPYPDVDASYKRRAQQAAAAAASNALNPSTTTTFVVTTTVTTVPRGITTTTAFTPPSWCPRLADFFSAGTSAITTPSLPAARKQLELARTGLELVLRDPSSGPLSADIQSVLDILQGVISRNFATRAQFLQVLTAQLGTRPAALAHLRDTAINQCRTAGLGPTDPASAVRAKSGQG
jgi:hypothetical protein